jgi:DNA-directed RNA polymerase specialized sigma24 family protein
VEDKGPLAGGDAGEELEALGDALGELGQIDPALAELVDMHFFGGFTFVEIASLRNVSDRTVQRDWRKARMLLHQILTNGS